MWSCGSFGIDPSWYHPAFGEAKEPPCFSRGEERPQHLEEEEEVPTRKPLWGKGQRRPHDRVEGLLIAGPARGCVASSLDTVVTSSRLSPGF